MALTSSDTVTVCCKLPLGLVIDIREAPIKVKDEIVAGQVLWSQVLRGYKEQRRLESNFDLTGETPHVVGGYGLTQDVNAERFAEWMTQNKDYAPVRAGLIFAMPKLDAARGIAAEKAEVKCGFEAIDPRRVDPSGVEPEEQFAKRAGLAVARRG